MLITEAPNSSEWYKEKSLSLYCCLLLLPRPTYTHAHTQVTPNFHSPEGTFSDSSLYNQILQKWNTPQDNL